MTRTIGSLASGYLGLDAAVHAVFGGELAWVADNDPDVCKLLACRLPGVPNLGDLTMVDWHAVEPVDILVAGFPCQDVSAAGLRAGIQPGNRSGLWLVIVDAIKILRPSIVVLENVRGLLSASAHSPVEPCPVCVWETAQPAGCGHSEPFSATWPTSGSMRSGKLYRPQRPGRRTSASGSSSSAGLLPTPDATHGRKDTRTGPLLPGAVESLLPTPRATDGTNGGPNQRGSSGDLMLPSAVQTFRTPTAQLAVNGGSQHPDKRREGGHGPTLADEVEHLLPTPSVADGTGGHKSRSGDRADEPLLAGVVTEMNAGDGIAWGPYAVAVARWAAVLGVLPPSPVEPGKTGMRLAAPFVEWMQGLPPGWVTDVPGLSRNAKLKILGNGVVSLQALLAFEIMLRRIG